MTAAYGVGSWYYPRFYFRHLGFPFLLACGVGIEMGVVRVGVLGYLR